LKKEFHLADPTTLSILKDVAMTCASVVGIYVALSGLTTWKRQVVGTDRINTVRTAISSLLAYRESVRRIRDLQSAIGDIPIPSESDRENMTGKQNYFIGLSKTYEQRLNDLDIARLNLEIALTEVEVVSMPVLKATKDNIYTFEHELRRTVSAFLWWNNPDLPQMLVTAAWKVLEPRFRIVVPNDLVNDEFATDLSLAIDNLVKELNYRRDRA
jgi:hypothetical protein